MLEDNLPESMPIISPMNERLIEEATEVTDHGYGVFPCIVLVIMYFIAGRIVRKRIGRLDIGLFALHGKKAANPKN